MNQPRYEFDSKPEHGNDNLSVSAMTHDILDFSHLMDDQRKFFEWLYTTPTLQPYQRYWKIHPSPEMDTELTKKVLKTASSGEAHMLRFLAGVWLGSNTFDFNMIDAIRDLNTQELKVIQAWVQSPFFP